MMTETIDDLAALRDRCKRAGFAVIRYDDGPVHSYPYDAPWLDDPDFSALYDKIRSNTLVDRVRCYALSNLCEQVRDLPGDVLEIGVWRGGTAGILASKLPEKTIFLADTFAGVVKASEWEHYQDAAHADTSIEIVERLLTDRLQASNYRILRGSFPEDTGEMLGDRPLALVHIDVDVYLSAKDAYNHVWDQVVPGGVVVFDDYGFLSACSGIRRLIQEISNDRDKLFIHNLNAHAYVIKRA
jgi:O-methyltransferase